MGRLRIYLAGLVVTLGLLFTVERLFTGDDGATQEPAWIAVTIVAIVGLIVLIPRFSQLPALLLVGGVSLWFLSAKTWLVEPSSGSWEGSSAAATLVTLVVTALAVLLAQKIASSFTEFEDAVANVSVGDEPRIRSLDAALDDIGIEMARARRHERPLTVSVIEFDHPSASVPLHRIVHDVQQTMMQRYIISGLARLALQTTRRGDIVVQDAARSRVIILSPEASPAQINNLAGRLQASAHDRLGLPVRFGSAGFPLHALTFDDLVEEAVRASNAGTVGAPAVRERVSSEPIVVVPDGSGAVGAHRDATASVFEGARSDD